MNKNISAGYYLWQRAENTKPIPVEVFKASIVVDNVLKTGLAFTKCDLKLIWVEEADGIFTKLIPENNFYNLESRIKNLPSEYATIINDNFWELIK